MLNIIKGLYHECSCMIKVKGQMFAGFPMENGVKQGCPLSPLLFVLAADFLLRKLHRHFPECTMAAFADDTAMVLTNLWRLAPPVLKIYRDFGQFSNLQLNIDKTEIVPLWPCHVSQLRRIIKDDMPEWAMAVVDTSATYLGVQVGPGRVGKEWTKALRKYEDRIQAWSGTSPGLLLTIQAYNTFILPVFSFLWQFFNPPNTLYKAEQLGLFRLTPGPGFWCTVGDLHHLDSLISFPVVFKDIRTSAWAAKLRLAHQVFAQNLTPLVEDFQHDLQHLPPHLDSWRKWYDSSIVWALQSAVMDANNLGIRAETIGDHPLHGSNTKSLQYILQDKIRSHHSIKMNTHNRIRHKMERWRLQVPPRILADRVTLRMKKVGKLVPPRVVSALWRTLWNGWCTSARFQRESRCIFGCGRFALDRIEHYAHCPFTLWTITNMGGLHYTPSVQTFLCMDPGLDEERLTKHAVLCYCIYKVYNLFRNTNQQEIKTIREALEHVWKETWCQCKR